MSDDAAYSVDHSALARTLASLLAERFELRRRDGVVIGVGGESGSGKSVTAIALANQLETSGLATRVIHQDDYFHRPPRANHDFRSLDLRHVGPHEVNLQLLRSHIAEFRAKRDGVAAPRVDYPSDSFISGRLDFGASDVLIVEGTYVLELDGIDVRIFLEATHEETHARRLERNRDIDAPFVAQVLRIEHEIIAPQVRLADVVIDRHFAITRRP